MAERELADHAEPPEAVYHREWALGVMERALAALRAEYERGRRKGDFATVARFFGLGEAPSYVEAAEACGLTPAQFKASLHRARARFRELVREQVAATVDDEGDVEREMADLVRALAG
jgi:RNA polymerase sigma-70 factor (ECF subfamily)